MLFRPSSPFRRQSLAQSLFAVAAIALLSGPGAAFAQSPNDPRATRADNPASLQQQVDALRAELQQMKAQQRPTTPPVPNRRANVRQASALFESESKPAPQPQYFHPSIQQPNAIYQVSPAYDPEYYADSEEPERKVPFFVSYGYNFGGGYTQLSDANEEYTVKLQNQMTIDGTFYDQANMPTSEKGFNIPFYRTYLYGNITKDWDYQLAVQGFLGQFNVLDAWVNYTFDDSLHIRAGRMLSPFLYEYWAFSPAWEPVITNSLLFQVAGKRQVGVMAWGKLWDNFAQYQAGIYNGVEGGFFDLDRSVDLLGSFTLTPWKGSDSIAESLGAGVSFQVGQQNYALNSGNTESFINGAGEPTLNFNYINSTGISFFQYNNDVVADGMRTKFAPHLFWYGNVSVQAEYMVQQRRLADSNTVGTSVLQGYQATVAWLMTGESRSGDGLGGWATVSPRSPFSPSRGQCGPGAWELAFQYSEMDVGTDNFKFGFANPATSTNRIQQTMLGLNWWPNKYTRLSFDWMYNKLNRSVPIGGQSLDSFNTYWTRAAMFF